MHLTATAVIPGGHFPLPDRWRSADGIQVEIVEAEEGAVATVDWPSAPDESSETWHLLEQELEDRVRLEQLSRLAPITLTWRSQTAAGATLFAPSVSAFGWAHARPSRQLSSLTTEAEALAAHPEVRDSIDLLRQAFEIWHANNGAALSRLFIAVEGVVIALRGDSRSRAWGQAASDVGLSEERGLQLFYSLQHARHAGLAQSKAWFP